ANQYVSTREMLEVWLYQDTGYASIQTMKARIHTLLHAVQLSGTFSCRWQGDIQPPRDTDLDASVERMEFEIRSKRSA
ncbi:MAG TPA: hypothetical protein VKA67_10090, partial [Verrucomicrobiae bacterium]|nr:hypothetical protein [Verrucomicrobiae bacterium]